MSKLPPTLLDQFLRGDHVLRYQHGIWNGIWSDMMIETSYMKFGKCPSGIIGKTTKPKTIQIWAKSQLSCSEVLQALDSITNKAENTMSTHKEEREGRIMADLYRVDKIKLKNLLETCRHPLDCDNHPQVKRQKRK